MSFNQIHSDINNRITSHKQHINELQVSMNSCIDIAENMEKYELSDHVEEQRKSIKHYITMEKDIQDRISILQRIQHGSLTETDNKTLSDILSNESGKLQKQRKDDHFKDHPKYKELQRRVFAINHPDELLSDDEEDGLLVVSQQVNIKCPLTKMTYEHPVKSSQCGHTFEKDAIYQVINRNRRNTIQCPYPGCNREISKSTLIRDKQMEEIVRKTEREIAASQRIVDEDVVRL